MSSKGAKHKAWQYEDFVFLVENWSNMTIRDFSSKFNRTAGAISVTHDTVRAWKRDGDSILPKGYSARIVRYCHKYFNKEEVDVTNPPRKVQLVEKEQEPIVVSTRLTPGLQEKLSSIDEILEVLKGRIVEVITQVVVDSQSESLKAENVELKKQNKVLADELDEYKKYKQAAKDSSVWGVLTRRFGAHNQQ